MSHAGLTDDPEKTKHEHGNPASFRIVQEFKAEYEARSWKRKMLKKGVSVDHGAGWKYGYTY